MYVLQYCFEQEYMHGMPLYEWCIIILLYMPTIVITIILEFSIGLWNGFWDIFKNLFNVRLLCSFNSKSCSINSIAFSVKYVIT